MRRLWLVVAVIVLAGCQTTPPQNDKPWLFYAEDGGIYDRETGVFLGYDPSRQPPYQHYSSTFTGPYYGYDWSIFGRGFIGADHQYHLFSQRDGKRR